MTTTVSVIIAAYNAERYIGKALASLDSQSRVPDEVIVIDDGSTDHTAAAVEAFKEQTRLNLIFRRQANKGLAATRNVGVRCSSGELIAFLDADDVMYPAFLESTVLALDRHRTWAACFTDRDLVDEAGKFLAKDLDHAKFQGIEKTRLGQDHVELTDPRLFCKMVGGNLIPMTIVFRRSALVRHDGFDESLRYGEDRFFLLGLIKQGDVLGYVDRSLGTWQQHDGNLTAAANSLRNWGYIDMILAKLLAKKEAWQLDDVELQCIRNAMRKAATSWIYSASSSCSPSTVRLAVRLLVKKRITFQCFVRAIGRYALHGVRRFWPTFQDGDPRGDRQRAK